MWRSALSGGDGPERKSANYESDYATGGRAQTRHEGANFIPSIAYVEIRLLGERIARQIRYSASDVLSSEEPSVERPGSWSDHRQRAAKYGQQQ